MGYILEQITSKDKLTKFNLIEHSDSYIILTAKLWDITLAMKCTTAVYLLTTWIRGVEDISNFQCT